jgi:hypothetical protein
VQACAATAGLDPARFAGHSLRAGFVTAAARAGGRLEDPADQPPQVDAGALGLRPRRQAVRRPRRRAIFVSLSKNPLL